MKNKHKGKLADINNTSRHAYISYALSMNGKPPKKPNTFAKQLKEALKRKSND
jgi:hypothetical protein